MKSKEHDKKNNKEIKNDIEEKTIEQAVKDATTAEPTLVIHDDDPEAEILHGKVSCCPRCKTAIFWGKLVDKGEEFICGRCACGSWTRVQDRHQFVLFGDIEVDN